MSLNGGLGLRVQQLQRHRVWSPVRLFKGQHQPSVGQPVRHALQLPGVTPATRRTVPNPPVATERRVAGSVRQLPAHHAPILRRRESLLLSVS